ncbi:hypothetical protein XFF6994_5680014 [Xanthomonas citri pv. fuscans]|nr:hypothetical protein XFF6994_5680014 [Xanthomonas citri pv. fuscans]
MDPRLLPYYTRELQHVRDMGAEFAREYPKIAGRLGLDAFECADPYVERLLEGFAFLAARVQLKLDAQYPVFTQHLLEMVYPHYLAPLPSMAVVQLQPDLKDSGLAAGVVVPRQSALRSLVGPGERTACQFRTAHAVTLWPLHLAQAKYLESPAALAAAGIALPPGRVVRAGVRLRFELVAGAQTHALALDRLPLFLAGADGLPKRLYEQLHADTTAVVVRGSDASGGTLEVTLGADAVQMRGFADDDALIPYDGRSFSGYRLLQEYFACPERFLFAELAGLRAPLRRCTAAVSRWWCCCNAACPAWLRQWAPSTSNCSAPRRSICSRAGPIASICRPGCTSTTCWPTAPGRWISRSITWARSKASAIVRSPSNASPRSMVATHAPGMHGMARSTACAANRACCRPASAAMARGRVMWAAKCSSAWSMPTIRRTARACASLGCSCGAATAICRCICRQARAQATSPWTAVCRYRAYAAWPGRPSRARRCRMGKLRGACSVNCSSIICRCSKMAPTAPLRCARSLPCTATRSMRPRSGRSKASSRCAAHRSCGAFRCRARSPSAAAWRSRSPVRTPLSKAPARSCWPRCCGTSSRATCR